MKSITSVFGLLACVGVANAVDINFDDNAEPCNFVETTALTTEYAALGVVFSGNAPGNGGGILDQCGNFGVNARSGLNFLAFNRGLQGGYSDGGTPTDPQRLEFSQPITAFSIWVSGGGNATTFRLQAFNGITPVGTSTASSPAGGYAELAFSDAGGFNRVVLTETDGDAAFVMDDLSFTVGGDDCPEDINDDGVVDIQDLLALLAAWGPCDNGGPEVCETGFTCGEMIEDCPSSDIADCFCWTGFDGDVVCALNDLCVNVQPCPDGNCPPGFVCLIDTCCDNGEPGCFPVCEDRNVIEFQPGDHTGLGVVPARDPSIRNGARR